MRQELSERARKLTGAAGAAVYVCEAGESTYEASVAWSCDGSIPDSPFSMRQVFEWLRDTGDALVFPDLTAKPLAALPPSLQRSVRSLVAVPILGADESVIGGICVFDVRPLAIGGGEVDALRALARTAAAGKDTLAAIIDRSGAEPAIARELARARRDQRPLSVVLFEMTPAAARAELRGRPSQIDPFDAASESLMRAIRGTDVPIRWAPGAVLLVLPGLALTEARPVAERVRAAMHAGARRQLAVAGGVAELAADESFETVVERAAERLRTARERGHNRIA
jgi:GGDEF domain-containing protein